MTNKSLAIGIKGAVIILAVMLDKLRTRGQAG
jgi:predicted ABC-type sugar transport system permease subunit